MLALNETFVSNDPSVVSLRDFASLLYDGEAMVREHLSAVVWALLDDHGQSELRVMSEPA
jgi:hypothetical protein